MAEELKPELIPDDVKKVIQDTFLKELKEPVLLEVYTKKGENDQFNDVSISLTKTFSELSDKVRVTFHTVGDEQSKKRDVLRSPTVLIAPDKYRIRYTGAPVGEEGRSFLIAIMMASMGKSILSAASMEKVASIRDKRHVQVFVSPTCPYCPQQALSAMSAAIVNPTAISAEIVEIFENQDLAEKLGSLAVPQTFMNGMFTGAGLQPEEIFVETLITLKEPTYVSEELTPGEPIEKDLVIIGGGPAGLSAAIYAVRAGLKSIVLEKSNLGGQVAITPVVENYPGFMRIGGKSLVDLIVQQAAQYADIHLGETVKEITVENNKLRIKTNRALYIAKGAIIATGVDSKRLDAPGERRLYGRGVSYCSTCDGYFFKDGKKVVVVGGGNTAATDALYLHNIGAQVTIVHRSEAMRAEARLLESIAQSKIPVLWSSEVIEVLGDKLVSAVKIKDAKTGATKEVPAAGVFVAIGYTAKNDVAKSLGLPLDEEGYIKVDLNMRTPVPFVYAAGDITGGAKQIVVAVSQGSVAAMSAFEDITSPYWVSKKEAPANKIEKGVEKGH